MIYFLFKRNGPKNGTWSKNLFNVLRSKCNKKIRKLFHRTYIVFLILSLDVYNLGMPVFQKKLLCL